MSKVHFLHIAFFIQFTTTENVFDVFGDNTSFFTEKLPHSLLCQPNRIILQKNINFYLSIISSIGTKIRLIFGEVIFIHDRLTSYSLLVKAWVCWKVYFSRSSIMFFFILDSVMVATVFVN